MTERILVSIITGGRPALSDRPTGRFIEPLRAAGFTDLEWVVREDQADQYERDDLPLNVYTVDWASRYAKDHWRHPTAVWKPGGFFGAFPGREWAMRTAEERGYDAVLQMDDNVRKIGLLNPTQPAYASVRDPGILLRLLCEVALSTNGWMTGAQLSSVIPKGMTRLVRPGYPYSVFVERCGPGRMPYYGPFEDDIMHALEYARNGGPNRSATVLEVIRYHKDSGGSSGMRKHYNASRGLEIANRYPENVRIGIGPRTSSPAGTSQGQGVRHFLNTRGFTPVLVTDPDRYLAADTALRQGVAEALEARRVWDHKKIASRAAGGR